MSLAGIAKMGSMWANINSYKDYNEVHTHGGAQISCVYYVKTPEGSSPIVFPDENETVEAKEGNLLIFPGHTNHYVPENKCEGRVIIAGNINLFNIGEVAEWFKAHAWKAC